jgi:vacuolar-type H+-ATPase subunit E/Vma4
MKIVFNRIIIAGIISPIFIISMVSSVTAVTVVKPNPKMVDCANVLALQTKSETDLATHITTMQTEFAARLAKINSDKTEVDKKVATNRANAKRKFEEKIQQLEQKTEPTKLNDTQKQAVKTFKLNMEQAETTREKSIDSARTKYRTDLLNVVTTNQQTIAEAVNLYQATVQSAFMTAQAKCGNGMTTTNKSDLKTAIQLARQTLTEVNAESKIKTQIKHLATTRNDAIKLANDTFKKSVATYKTELTAALEPVKKLAKPSQG